MKIKIKLLEPRLWKDLELLFGKNGACGGCWCMFWRQALGEKWSELKGFTNRRRFKKMVLAKRAHGALAYIGEEPVGWVSFDKRKDFLKLDRSPSFQCQDTPQVREQIWSIPCFYIKPRFRGKGVATALLSEAIKHLRRKNAKIIEAYPVNEGVKNIPAVFAWTGTTKLFKKAGFKPINKARKSKSGSGKQLMRLAVSRAL